MRIVRASLVAVVVLSLTMRSGLAQDAAGHLARLTSTEGFVRVDRGDGTAGDPGLLNMPLTERETIATGEDGQAEVEFEDGSLARLTPNTTLKLARLGGGSGAQLALGKGLAYFELRYAPGISYTVLAGADRLRPVENTTVRINLDEPPPAIAVLDGTAQVERTGSYATDVRAGETFRADTTGAGRYFLTAEIAPDTWDAWNEARDQQAADAAARQTEARTNYAGAKGYGWSDLDANGTWYDMGAQGQVWQPQGGDDAGFDPYGNGSWVWYPAGGYVWASAYSWGWTPFRCGNWSYWNSFGWGWAPAGNCVNFGGGFGYGYGGGYDGSNGRGLLNISLAPRGYLLNRPPNPTRPGLHPIVSVGSGPMKGGPMQGGLMKITPYAPSTPGGTRMIGGVRAIPLRGTALGYTPRGGSATGAALVRDYPVDRASHVPVMGVRPGQGAASGFTPSNADSVQTIYGIGGVRGGTVVAPRVPTASGQSVVPVQPGVYGRAPGSSIQQQRVPQRMGQENMAPRQMAPAPHPTYSAPAAAPHMSAPSPAAPHISAPAAAVPSGKK